MVNCRDVLAPRRRDGEALEVERRTRRLSSVKSTATPASTLPTVRETSIACVGRIVKV
jgi:hypothetical protein